MSVLKFLVPFHPINTARVVFSSDLKSDPLNLYPTIAMEDIDIEDIDRKTGKMGQWHCPLSNDYPEKSTIIT